jgi:hypothetical protein
MQDQSCAKIVVAVTHGDRDFSDNAECIGYVMTLLIQVGQKTDPAQAMKRHAEKYDSYEQSVSHTR